MIVEYVRYTIPAERRGAFESAYGEAASALDASPLNYLLAGGFFLLAPALVVILIIRKYLLTTWGRVAR